MPLQSFIYARQNDAALVNQLDKWVELRVNPFGWRDSEFFEWGLKGHAGGRIEELRKVIDSGMPAPLGLYEGGTTDYRGTKAGDHQVLAIGYDMGRYTGDLGRNKQDFKIFIYDPNYPNAVCTLVPDISRKCYFYVENGNARRTYFVDQKHRPKTPPDLNSLAANEPDGSIRNIYVQMKTGVDDLRGENDNVHITVNFKDSTKQTFENVNGRARWVSDYEETVPLRLNRSIRRADITSVTLRTTFSEPFGDKWDLEWLKITNGGNLEILHANPNHGDLFKFSADQNTLTLRVP